jgi:hypothetical protein
MASTTLAVPTAARPSTKTHLLRTGVIAGVAAATATATTAAVAHGVGVPLKVDGDVIPTVGFAQLAFVFVLVGAGIAKLLAAKARHPRATFTMTTVALTAISVVPDALVHATTATKLTLALTHLVAAAIAIPALASRLSD